MALSSRPTIDEVNTHVRHQIADYVLADRNMIKDNSVLRNPPLKYDDSSLTNLATALRTYIKQFEPTKTLTPAEAKKAGVTVGTLCEMVRSRVGATALKAKTVAAN